MIVIFLLMSSLIQGSEFQPPGVVLPPGDTGPYLGTSVVVTIRDASGIEWVGAMVFLNTPQCSGRPPTENDLALTSTGSQAETP